MTTPGPLSPPSPLISNLLPPWTSICASNGVRICDMCTSTFNSRFLEGDSSNNELLPLEYLRCSPKLTRHLNVCVWCCHHLMYVAEKDATEEQCSACWTIIGFEAIFLKLLQQQECSCQYGKITKVMVQQGQRPCGSVMHVWCLMHCPHRDEDLHKGLKIKFPIMDSNINYTNRIMLNKVARYMILDELGEIWIF